LIDISTNVHQLNYVGKLNHLERGLTETVNGTGKPALGGGQASR
jgi:hypothetical protein